MLSYYNENVTLEEFIIKLLECDQSSPIEAPSLRYVLVPDAVTAELQFNTSYLTPKIINWLDKIKLVKIDKWSDMYAFVEVLLEDLHHDCSKLGSITVALYGLFNHFIKRGNESESMQLTVGQCESARKLNELCHYWFKNHVVYGFRVIINDSTGVSETTSIPILWRAMINKVNDSSTAMSLISEESKIQLRYIFMKWVEIITLDSYTKGKTSASLSPKNINGPYLAISASTFSSSSSSSSSS